MLTSFEGQRQVGRATLIVAAILLLSASSPFLLNEPLQATLRTPNDMIAFAINQDNGNCTCQTTLTSYVTAYDTTTITQTSYLSSTTLITVSSTILVPVSTLTATKVVTTTVRSLTTSVTIATSMRTAFTNVTNTKTVTSVTQTSMRTTQTITETSTTYTRVPSTATVTEATTLTSSVQVTQAIALFSNPIAELATALLVLAALATLVVPRIRARRFTGKVCPQCGYRNPPYARSFCIKCGNPLETHET